MNTNHCFPCKIWYQKLLNIFSSMRVAMTIRRNIIIYDFNVFRLSIGLEMLGKNNAMPVFSNFVGKLGKRINKKAWSIERRTLLIICMSNVHIHIQCTTIQCSELCERKLHEQYDKVKRTFPFQNPTVDSVLQHYKQMSIHTDR